MLECSVCLGEDESQEHIYQCKQIWKLKNESRMEVPKYENILYGDVKQKVKVARIFQDNMKIREQKIS